MKVTIPLTAALLALPLTLSAQEGEVLVAAGSDWEYLYYSDATNVPADPATANPAFHTTWHTPPSYSGTPAFQLGTSMLGWGSVPDTVNEIVTNIWGSRDGVATPPSGQRFTSYLRTTFTPTATVTRLLFDARVDDGAIIYLNGTEVGRINMPDAATAPDAWDLFATGTGNENVNVVLDLDLATPLPAGFPVNLAVSLHNASATSSDIGFNARVVALIPVPAPNDNFADAELITGPLPIAVTGRSDDLFSGLGATEEASEPDHAGAPGGASVWYTWTPTVTQRVSITTAGSTFDTLLGVYTGGSLAALTEVASNNEVSFYAGSRVEFEAQAGTAYSIAVDGEAAAFGTIALAIAAAPEPFDPTELLIAAGSNWDYLLFNNTVNTFDPDAVDPDGDYHTTWQTAGAYNGPAFANGPAPLGYGDIMADPISTTVFEPATGQRNAALYVRSTFTPTAPVTNLAFRGLLDDGAIVYIDGVEVARMNVSPLADATNFRSTAATTQVNGAGTENAPQFAIVAQTLPAGIPVEIGVSVHNTSATSSDLAFDIEVYSTTTPPPPDAAFVAFIATTANPGEYEVSWPSQLGATYDVEFSIDLETWSVLITGVPGDASGTTAILDTPGTPVSYYRIVRP